MNQYLCKNCEHVFEGNFCNNCGQKSNTVQLNWHFVKEELQYTFLHINKGLLYTVKQLLTRPGKTVKEYIEGKRVKHYKPILLVFVLAGLNGLLAHYLNFEKVITLTEKEKNLPVNPLEIMNWVTSHYALVEILLIPIYSLCSWLAFKKWGYNYIENIIINCFASGQRLIYGILVFPISYLTFSSKYFLIITSLISLPMYFLTAWLYVELYAAKNKDLGFIILRLILFIVLLIIAFIVFILLVTFLLMFLSKVGLFDKHSIGL